MQWVQMASKGIATLGEGIVQKDNARTEREVEDQNARNLDDQASQLGQAGARDEERSRREYRQFAGMQFGALSEGSLGLEGSALDVARDSESQAFLDALNIRYDAGERVREVRYEARQARSRSALAREMEKRARYKILFESTGVIGNTDKFSGISGKGAGGGGGMSLGGFGGAKKRSSGGTGPWATRAVAAGGG